MATSEKVLPPLVVFRVDDEKWAVPVSEIERVVRAVEIAPCPDAPAAVLGSINVHGDVLAVFDLRLRIGKVSREITLSDCFLIAHAGQRRIALVADEIIGVLEPDDSSSISSKALLPETSPFDRVCKRVGEIVIIYDLERLLSEGEESLLATVLAS